LSEVELPPWEKGRRNDLEALMADEVPGSTGA
jgi:hypothetical protein